MTMSVNNLTDSLNSAQSPLLLLEFVEALKLNLCLGSLTSLAH